MFLSPGSHPHHAENTVPLPPRHQWPCQQFILPRPATGWDSRSRQGTCAGKNSSHFCIPTCRLNTTILYLRCCRQHFTTLCLLYQHKFILNFVWFIIFQDILPTLCFYDVSNGQESSDSSGSFSNEKEADFVSFLIEVLLNAGVDAASIGVITLYKSQMYSILVKLGTSR